jgi:hypothetical protein
MDGAKVNYININVADNGFELRWDETCPKKNSKDTYEDRSYVSKSLVYKFSEAEAFMKKCMELAKMKGYTSSEKSEPMDD